MNLRNRPSPSETRSRSDAIGTDNARITLHHTCNKFRRATHPALQRNSRLPFMSIDGGQVASSSDSSHVAPPTIAAGAVLCLHYIRAAATTIHTARAV